MKNRMKLTAAALSIAIASSFVHAQEEQQQVTRGEPQQDLRGEGDQVHETLVPQPEGTALINAPDGISLEQVAVDKPSELAGILITDSTGMVIGEVDRIARRISDNVLHAIVRTEDGPLAATELDDLNVNAFALWNPESALPDIAYRSEDFEVVDQHQVGHSAFGSLADPSGETVSYSRYSRTPGVADQQVAADVAAQQTDEPVAAGPGLTGGSAIVQMALTQSDQMKGIRLTSATGGELGVIGEILRNTSDGMLYALVNTQQGPTPVVVNLDQLQVGQLVLQAQRGTLQDRSFDEINFRNVQDR